MNLTVHFKNGEKVQITKENGNHIKNKILQGASQFQMFETEDGYLLVINLHEVTYIL